MSIATELLKTELATFEQHKSELLGEGEGKYVLIQGDAICGLWDTSEDAIQVGYERFGVDTPFLVKQVSAVERIHFFTRPIGSCPS